MCDVVYTMCVRLFLYIRLWCYVPVLCRGWARLLCCCGGLGWAGLGWNGMGWIDDDDDDDGDDNDDDHSDDGMTTRAIILLEQQRG